MGSEKKLGRVFETDPGDERALWRSSSMAVSTSANGVLMEYHFHPLLEMLSHMSLSGQI